MKQLSRIAGGLGALLVVVSLLSYQITQEFSLTYQVVGFVGVALISLFTFFHVDELLEAFGSRSARYSAFALVYCALFGIVLGFVNYIAYKHPKRYDATHDKVYSLSDQTQKILSSLKEPVQLTTFFEADSLEQTQFKDLLERYSVFSDKLKVTYIDALKDPTAVKQFGVTALNTVVVGLGNNEKRLTVFTEESLTNALVAVTRTTRKTVCFVEGHGEKTVTVSEKHGLSEVKGGLEKQSFTVQNVQLFQTQKVPEECTVLVLPGPERPLFPQELTLVNDWVKAGGRLIVMVDPGAPAEVSAMLQEWGLEARNDLVVDPVANSFFGNAAVPLGVPVGPHKITERLDQTPVFFPLARSLEKVEGGPSGASPEWLLQTASADAWGETDPSMLKPPENKDQQPMAPEQGDQDHKGPLNLAAIVTLPEVSASPEPAADPTQPAEQKSDARKPQGKVIAFGDSDFVTNAYFYSSANGDLFMNAVSFLAEEDDLIAIRPREKGKETLTLTDAQKAFIAYLCLLIMPVVPMVTGIYVYFRRRTR